MNKKDIYEHLAHIYLDASKTKKKSKTKDHFKYLFFASLALVVLLTISYAYFMPRSIKLARAQVALVLQSEASKINFHFDPAKKEIYAIGLNKLNMTPYKMLGFTIRKGAFQDTVTIRISFANTFQETAQLYVRDISHRWQDYRIPLSDFKGIANWNNMTELCFVVEEWNARDKNGVVYIDNIRLLR